MNTKAISDLLFENRERIEELEAVNARFRAALEQYADEGNWVEKGFHWAHAVERGYTQARRALGREEA